jgi:hypothetical protein
MSTEPQVLEPQCAWTADDVADDTAWTEVLDPDEQAELDSALHLVLEKTDDVLDVERADFPLPLLSVRLRRIEHDLIDGRGFVRLRGIDRSAYSQSEMELIYWGIGRHLGTPWPQNRHGHVLGDVTDQGRTATDPTARGNEIGGHALPFHCDGSDLVGLLCLDDGRQGGRSAVASSVQIHNRLVAEEPDLARALYEPLPYDFRGEEPHGGRPYYLVPVFTRWQDRLFVRCIPPYIRASQRHPEAPRLTELQDEALRTLVAMAEDPANHITMQLEPGDVQLINNHHVLHGRTAYEDSPDDGRIRHLKRLWLESRALPTRPPHLENRTRHWLANRSASRLDVRGQG